jgi:vacuolar-type H+-ATPase subunit H
MPLTKLGSWCLPFCDKMRCNTLDLGCVALEIVAACGGVEPVEDVLGRVLSIEAEAKAVVSEAQGLAVLLKQQATEEAEQIRLRARQEAEKEAEALREQEEREVQEERTRILARADQEPERVQDTEHFEQAVAYVVTAILGLEEGQE